MAKYRPLPDGRIEVFRVANVGTRGALLTCPGCNRSLYMLFSASSNDLEVRECCGHEFRLVHKQVDAVIYKLPTDPSQEFLSKKQPFEASAT